MDQNIGTVDSEVEAFSLSVLHDLVVEWREHWLGVEALIPSLPDEVRARTNRLPSDTGDALKVTREQFARWFHPDAVRFFLEYLGAAECTLARLIESGTPKPAAVQGLAATTDPARQLAELKSRVAALETVICGAGAILCSVPSRGMETRS